MLAVARTTPLTQIKPGRYESHRLSLERQRFRVWLDDSGAALQLVPLRVDVCGTLVRDAPHTYAFLEVRQRMANSRHLIALN
jgi:hypothetical protein